MHIGLSLSLNNIDKSFKEIFCKYGKLFKEISWEVEMYSTSKWDIFRFDFTINRMFHPGVFINIGIWKYTFGVCVYGVEKGILNE